MSDLEAEYQLEYFHEEGFVRTECPSCGERGIARYTI
jgi:alanyl-tRNA synthetase